MRQTTWVLILSLATTGQAWAQDDEQAPTSPLEIGGSFFTRYEMRQNYDPIGGASTDMVRYRARLNLDTAPVDIAGDLQLTIRFSPQASGLWNVGSDSLEDLSLGLHEGALVLWTPTLQAEVGRFEMVFGDHLVIGNVGWHQTGRAFDGARFRLLPHENQDFWIEFFGTFLAEGLVEGPTGNRLGAGDEVFLGVYGALGETIGDGFILDAYVFANIWPEVMGRSTASQATIGARVKNRSGALDYRLETGVQVGTRPAAAGDNQSVLAYHGDLEIGVRAAEDKFRISLEGHFASGDDPETADDTEGWDHLFPTAHKWLGTMDVVGGRSNVYGGVLHASYQVSPAVRLGLDGHTFFRPQTPADVDSYLGSEVDLGALWKIGNGLGLRAGGGVFIPSDDFADDPLYFTELELRYDR